MYSQKVLEHFKSPHNQGQIKDPDGVGQVGNPRCGDLMKIYIKINNNNGQQILQDIKFETLGCAAAIAASSMVTVLAKGKTLQQALALSNDDIVRALDGLPEAKIHCSLLGVEALKKAIANYRQK